MDASNVKRLRNATIMLKSMIKAKIHHAHFIRCYKTKKLQQNFILMFNKHQKYWLTKLLKETGEYKTK